MGDIYDIGFIITSYLENEEHKSCLIQSINSILRFYKEKQVVIIFSNNTSINYINNIKQLYKDIIIEHEQSDVPAIMKTIYYIINKKYFKNTVVIHDSMVILDKFNLSENYNNKIAFLWHFTNHRCQWSYIMEPTNDFNTINNIKTHDDLILFLVNKYCNNNDFLAYFNNIYYEKNDWIGCFGNTFIINIDYAFELNQKTDIINILNNCKNNRERRAAESIFSIACQYTLNEKIISSYDGLYYDGISIRHTNNISKHIYKRTNSFNR